MHVLPTENHFETTDNCLLMVFLKLIMRRNTKKGQESLHGESICLRFHRHRHIEFGQSDVVFYLLVEALFFI